eukprot:625938-Pleurochrysis_carterae.AAC.1
MAKDTVPKHGTTWQGRCAKHLIDAALRVSPRSPLFKARRLHPAVLAGIGTSPNDAAFQPIHVMRGRWTLSLMYTQASESREFIARWTSVDDVWC